MGEAGNGGHLVDRGDLPGGDGDSIRSELELSVRDDEKSDRHQTPRRATRTHQGRGHWHVERRSTVIVCRACQARIPTWKNPDSCPECGAGERESD